MKYFKRTLQLLFVFVIFFIFSKNTHAQADYNTAIGARVAPASGLTVKHFTGERSALEGILSTRWGGFVITGLYEYHQPAFGVESINFYYGAGAHVGFWDEPGNPWWDNEDEHVLAGIDGIIGLEYTFESIPFNISLDWKPAFNIGVDDAFWYDEIAFSVRFTF
jgi:hypothetical protein